ncbi:MAG: Na/Pi symporter, partial [Bacteroidales bacterium]|nr:Na/Pi symporter [Bacteroidales bacterium]
MDHISILKAVLALLSGIGIFLIACQMMSSNLEAASSDRLKRLFGKTSSNPFLGVGIGAASTALIQSSGATTVMTIGFVNAGIISLYQAATLIYGANIGTTVTAQIVALGMFGGNGISTTLIFSAFAGLGAFMVLFSKKDGWKTVGGIITGFGMLFVGLSLMSGSMEAFAAQDAVKTFLASITNPLLLVLIGALLTAIIQSSSVMTSIALAMVVTGLISLDQGIMLTMGSNIGSCVVAILAGVTSGLNARRTALIHLLFNCFGVVFFLIIAWIISLFSDISYGSLFAKWFPHAPQTQLAMFHTFFNTITVAVMLPLTRPLVNLVCHSLPEKKEGVEPAMKLHYVNENMLRT